VDQLSLDLSQGRDSLVEHLNTLVQKRKSMQESVDVEELWDVVHAEEDEIDIDMMTGLCFDDVNDDNKIGCLSSHASQ
jgi:hypothetical protein